MAQQGMGMSGGSSSGKSGLSGEQERIAREDTGSQAVSYSAGGATIQADPATNSLIISAPEPLYRSIAEIIAFAWYLKGKRPDGFVEDPAERDVTPDRVSPAPPLLAAPRE